MREHATLHEDHPICPYCGHVHLATQYLFQNSQTYKEDGAEVSTTCVRCTKKIRIRQDVTVKYSTYKDDAPEFGTFEHDMEQARQ